MEELERRDKCSNSLLANVLDMDDDFLAGTGTDKVWFGQYFRRDLAMTVLLKVHVLLAGPHLRQGLAW
jgi:hypothetical protein